MTIQPHDRITIPCAELEFNAGSNTIWIHSKEGSTILRIKCSGKIVTDVCQNSPSSHADIMVNGDISFCVSEDALI